MGVLRVVCATQKSSIASYAIGAKGIAKVSPVLVCVDVVLSLADMIHSYGQYRAAKEQTKQLEIIRNTLRKQYENLLIELRLDKQKLRLQLAKDLEKIDARIHKNVIIQLVLSFLIF
ncbi:hypothetical protein KVL85_04950 [Helicobacter pylori]|nr:hypothetical protein KVL85_04950 [Helicobacter pylori]